MALYRIVIQNKTSSEKPLNAVTKESEGLGGEVSSAEAAANVAVKMLKKAVSVGAIVHTVDQIVSQQRSTISLRTGAQEYGQRASYAYQKASGFIKSVAMGAIVGKSAGLPGMIAGASVAALLNVGGQVMDYFMKQDVILKEQSLEDISRRLQMTRATVSGRRYSNIMEI